MAEGRELVLVASASTLWLRWRWRLAQQRHGSSRGGMVLVAGAVWAAGARREKGRQVTRPTEGEGRMGRSLANRRASKPVLRKRKREERKREEKRKREMG